LLSLNELLLNRDPPLRRCGSESWLPEHLVELDDREASDLSQLDGKGRLSRRPAPEDHNTLHAFGITVDTGRQNTVLLGIAAGGIMLDNMGSFRIDVEVENPARPGNRRTFQSVLIDTGAELSVFPASVLESLHIGRFKELHFRQADGSVLARWVGSALVYAAGTMTTDDIVFGEPGDLILLGARSLEGLNVRIDPVSKRLVDAGPMPLAAVA
jgi:predicted aspartyl protease